MVKKYLSFPKCGCSTINKVLKKDIVLMWHYHIQSSDLESNDRLLLFFLEI